jgi:hypothetical protein
LRSRYGTETVTPGTEVGRQLPRGHPGEAAVVGPVQSDLVPLGHDAPRQRRKCLGVVGQEEECYTNVLVTQRIQQPFGDIRVGTVVNP